MQVANGFCCSKIVLRMAESPCFIKKDNPRHIGMLSRKAYPILGPSVAPSRVIFEKIVR